MKTLFILISSIVLTHSGYSNPEAKKVLLDHLDLRIKANIEYDIQYAGEAAESEIAERLVPIERKNGHAWVEYLKFLKAKSDFESISRMLRIEILGELVTTLYDLEYAENKLEKLKLETQVNKWQRQLKEVETAMDKLGIKITPRETKK